MDERDAQVRRMHEVGDEGEWREAAFAAYLIQVRNVEDLQVLQRDEARNPCIGNVDILTDVESPAYYKIRNM